MFHIIIVICVHCDSHTSYEIFIEEALAVETVNVSKLEQFRAS